MFRQQLFYSKKGASNNVNKWFGDDTVCSEMPG